MVKVYGGVLITCDIPTKTYLLWLSKQIADGKTRGTQFLAGSNLADLDDTHLLIKQECLQWVREQVREFNNKNVYTPPVDQQQQ